jgi:hypothetical protein
MGRDITDLDQPPLFTEGLRAYSPETEADELRVAILEHIGAALQRTVEPEDASCPRCGQQVRAFVGDRLGDGPGRPTYAYCQSCLWCSRV